MIQIRFLKQWLQTMEIGDYITRSEEETIALGRKFAARLKPGDVVALYGELGAGKTEFVKGICDYFHVHEIVSSPTFTIINRYEGEDPQHHHITLYHIDLYRVNTNKELREIGLEECTEEKSAIKLIEWAEKANGTLPKRRYSIYFEFSPEDINTRHIHIRFDEQQQPESEEEHLLI